VKMSIGSTVCVVVTAEWKTIVG